MDHEASLLNIEKVTRLGALLQMPGTTAQFKVTIQAQMEQIAKEMIEPKQAAPPQPIDISPGVGRRRRPRRLLACFPLLKARRNPCPVDSSNGSPSGSLTGV